MQVKPADIGPLSPRHRLRRLDRRTKEGKFIFSTEQALFAHLGGAERVSVTKRILIERVACDLLRLELLDEKILTGAFTDHDMRIAHALRNSVRLALRDLGLDAPSPKAPTLTDYIAQRKTGS